MKITKTIAAGLLVLGMGSAFAAEPVALTDAQMDNVNGGGAAALSLAGSFAVGAVSAATQDATLTYVSQDIVGTPLNHGIQFTSYSKAYSAGAAF